MEPPNIVAVNNERAKEMVSELRAALAIASEVQIVVVRSHPLVFSVEPVDSTRQRFRLLMEIGFLALLDDDELLGAMAHEMGHVWIYTHHPYLHTERLANVIGQRVVARISFEKVYRKLWAYEGTSGVPMEEVLGPPQVTEGVSVFAREGGKYYSR
jgi:hypothetical protein